MMSSPSVDMRHNLSTPHGIIAPSGTYTMAEISLATIRDQNSYCQPPNLQTVERCNLKEMDALLTDVALSARYSLALLKDLPALETSCIPRDAPAFERLRQERQRAYQAVQAYVRWIFEPTISLAQIWIDEAAQCQKERGQNKLAYLEEHVVRLRSELKDTQWPETYHESLDMGKMPSRSPWGLKTMTETLRQEIYISYLVLEEFFSDRMKQVESRLTNGHFKPSFSNVTDLARDVLFHEIKSNGGIPRATFLTVHGIGEQLTVVLGFSATAWADDALHAGATKCRDQDLAKYGPSPSMELRENAVKEMRAAGERAGKGGWTTPTIADAITDFRKRFNRKPFLRVHVDWLSHFPPEDGLVIADIVDTEKTWSPSCAEVEAIIVIEQLEQKRVEFDEDGLSVEGLVLDIKDLAG
ncbi:MAG: hypothetical protein Q9181_002336 [Wetmoreana brouardii]